MCKRDIGGEGKEDKGVELPETGLGVTLSEGGSKLEPVVRGGVVGGVEYRKKGGVGEGVLRVGWYGMCNRGK